MKLRRLIRAEAAEAAQVHSVSFEARLPWLAGLHTPEEITAYFETVVFEACELWGAFDGADLVSFLAFREGWIDQLYVLPARQGQGIGGGLLALAQARFETLQLWTFQKNASARAFYEKHGFVVEQTTDGARNIEREPDVRYAWRRPARPNFRSA